MQFKIQDFHVRFPDDDACLREIMRLRYGYPTHCPSCEKISKFHKMKKRRCYECQWCGRKIYPTKGTIFEKSTTPLKYWFYAMYLITSTPSGVTAKELERQLGVTYKCAWRIAREIRKVTDGHQIANPEG